MQKSATYSLGEYLLNSLLSLGPYTFLKVQLKNYMRTKAIE